MTKIYFVRHAQPDFSIHDDRIRPLTGKGWQDSKKVTSFLADKNVEMIFSSPYQRSIDTVRDFADTTGLQIHIVDDLRERKITNAWIDDFEGYSKDQWSDFDYKLPEGESLREVQERNISALNSILKKHKNKVIVIATHGTALSTIINYYNESFTLEDFMRIKDVMPFIVEMELKNDACLSISEILL